jgi:hypothetical protein
MGTKLEGYLKRHRIKPIRLVRESGYSRGHLLLIRSGKIEPSRLCIAAITEALYRLSGERVKASDLFELEPEYLD